MMRDECRLISSSQWTTVAGDVGSGGGCAGVGAGGIWESFVPSPQVFCEPEIALKKEVFKQNIQMRKRFKSNVELRDGWMKGLGILSNYTIFEEKSLYGLCAGGGAVFSLNILQNNALQVTVTLTKAEGAEEVDEVRPHLVYL